MSGIRAAAEGCQHHHDAGPLAEGCVTLTAGERRRTLSSTENALAVWQGCKTCRVRCRSQLAFDAAGADRFNNKAVTAARTEARGPSTPPRLSP